MKRNPFEWDLSILNITKPSAKVRQLSSQQVQEFKNKYQAIIEDTDLSAILKPMARLKREIELMERENSK